MRRPPVWALPALLAVLVVAAATLTGLRWFDRVDEASLEDAPVAVGEEVATDFFTLDHRTLDDDIHRVLARATGEFEQQYRTQSADLRRAVKDQQLVLTASVPESGTALEYLGDDVAWVLVSVDVHTEGAKDVSQDGRYSTRVVLERVDGEWRVSRLEQVG